MPRLRAVLNSGGPGTREPPNLLSTAAHRSSGHADAELVCAGLSLLCTISVTDLTLASPYLSAISDSAAWAAWLNALFAVCIKDAATASELLREPFSSERKELAALRHWWPRLTGMVSSGGGDDLSQRVEAVDALLRRAGAVSERWAAVDDVGILKVGQKRMRSRQHVRPDFALDLARKFVSRSPSYFLCACSKRMWLSSYCTHWRLRRSTALRLQR